MRFHAFAAILFLALLVAPIAASRPTGHANGKIAYASGNAVVAINPSGGRARTIAVCSWPTSQGCLVRALAWSRDGKKLAFLGGYQSGGEVATRSKIALFVGDANGRHLRRLLGCGDCGVAWGSSISWSPDGSTIALTDNRTLMLVKVKTGLRKLVDPCAVVCEDVAPAWSPDGSRIAFGRGASLYGATRSGAGVNVIDVNVIATVPGDGQVGHPSWSPDGKTLAFDDADSIFTVAADGSHLTRLLAGQPGSGPGVPAWSPDGTRIVYFNTPGSPGAFDAEVWVMNPDGTEKHRLYRSGCCVGDWAAPVWSPDGTRIAFSPGADRTGLMVMNANGSVLHQVAGPVTAFAWQPLPR